MWRVLYVVLLALPSLFAQDPQVRIGKSTITGRFTDVPGLGRFQEYIGIPYAQPPERWGDPVYKDPRESSYTAKTLKPMCPQGCTEASLWCNTNPPQNEDCLYMNIYTPENAAFDVKRLAVMVYIHGGNFDAGSGFLSIYYPLMIVGKGDVIVASINYRLGAFGFLATGNDTNDIKGNFGIKDQRMAMRWLKRNIKYFGGNPKKITIFGQSAGAQSIGVHLMNKKADSYFKRAILQSCPFTLSFRTYEEAKIQAVNLAIPLGCTRKNTKRMIKCLRRKPMQSIISAQAMSLGIPFSSSFFLNNFQSWGPVVDGIEVPGHYMEQQDISSKRVIIGYTKDEGVGYIFGFFNPITYDEFFSVTKVDPTGIEEKYPAGDPADVRPELSNMASDFIFRCPALKFSEQINEKTWVYEFDAGFSLDALIGAIPQCIGKACHGGDIPYVFQAGPLFQIPYTSDEIILSDSVIQYWTTFAKKGDPGTSMGLKWKNYRNKYLIFEKPSSRYGVTDRHAQCELWSQRVFVI